MRTLSSAVIFLLVFGGCKALDSAFGVAQRGAEVLSDPAVTGIATAVGGPGLGGILTGVGTALGTVVGLYGAIRGKKALDRRRDRKIAEIAKNPQSVT